MMKPVHAGVPVRLSAMLALLLSALAVSPVLAQGSQRSNHLSIGVVYVSDAGGAETRGQLLRLGPDTLTLLEGGSTRDIRLTDVARIETRGDSVKNGALIGAAVFAGWCAVICPQGLDGYSGRAFAYTLAINTALGAAVGAGIDGMHVGRTTIYQPQESQPGRRAGVRAFLSKRLRF